jgi:hypothetical protein
MFIQKLNQLKSYGKFDPIAIENAINLFNQLNDKKNLVIISVNVSPTSNSSVKFELKINDKVTEIEVNKDSTSAVIQLDDLNKLLNLPMDCTYSKIVIDAEKSTVTINSFNIDSLVKLFTDLL